MLNSNGEPQCSPFLHFHSKNIDLKEVFIQQI